MMRVTHHPFTQHDCCEAAPTFGILSNKNLATDAILGRVYHHWEQEP